MKESDRKSILHKKIENPGMSHNDIAKELKVAKSSVTFVLKGTATFYQQNERKAVAKKKQLNSRFKQGKC